MLLEVAVWLAFREEPVDGGHIVITQGVGEFGETAGHLAQQDLHVLAVLHDHRACAVRVGERHTRHVAP